MTNIWKMNSSAHKVRDKGLKVGWLRLMSVSVNKQGVKWQKINPFMHPVFKSPNSYQPQKVIFVCRLVNQDSGSSGPGSSPGRGHCVVLLFTHVYKWVTANMLGITLRCTSIPSRGE